MYKIQKWLSTGNWSGPGRVTIGRQIWLRLGRVVHQRSGPDRFTRSGPDLGPIWPDQGPVGAIAKLLPGYLQNRTDLISVPSANWSYSKGNELFFGSQRVENDGTIRKRVAVLPDLSLKIIVDNNLIPFCKYIKVGSIEEFENHFLKNLFQKTFNTLYFVNTLIPAVTTCECQCKLYNDDHFENFQNLCYNGFSQEALEYVI